MGNVILDQFDPGDYRMIHNGSCAVFPDENKVNRILTGQRVDDRWPIFYAELCSYRAKGNVYVAQGQALAAKMLTLVMWLGPLREESGVPFSFNNGMGYDPVWDPEVKGYKVTHRGTTKRSKQAPPIVLPNGEKVHWSISQHGHQPERGAFGSASDFKPKGFSELMREEIVVWLKKRHLSWEFVPTTHGKTIKKVSIGAYKTFVHGDVRPPGPAYWRDGGAKPKPPYASSLTGDVAQFAA